MLKNDNTSIKTEVLIHAYVINARTCSITTEITLKKVLENKEESAYNIIFFVYYEIIS